MKHAAWIPLALGVHQVGRLPGKVALLVFRQGARFMAKLSTHVLDTVNGIPAPDLAVTLYRVTAAGRERLVQTRTNADGRTDQPLLSGDTIPTGVYELDFEAGDYFRGLGIKLPDPAFVDRVTLRFGIADASGHYHVPLLASPWTYSTYRGS